MLYQHLQSSVSDGDNLTSVSVSVEIHRRTNTGHKDKAEYSAFDSTLKSSIVSYRIKQRRVRESEPKRSRNASLDGASTISSSRWFQSIMVLTKKECPYGSLFDGGTRQHLLLLVTWESMMLLVMWSLKVLTRTARVGKCELWRWTGVAGG